MAITKGHNLVYFRPGGAEEDQERIALTLDGDWTITGGIRPDINSATISYLEYAKIEWPIFNLFGDVEFWYSYKPGDTYIPEGEEEPVDAEPDVVLNLQFVVNIQTIFGTTPTSAGARVPVKYRFQFADSRHAFVEPRGGILQRGLVNSETDPTNFDDANTNSALMGSCFTAMGMTGSIASTVNDIDAPTDLEWDGVHAPSALCHLLELTGHVYAQQSTGQAVIVKPGIGSLPTIPSERLVMSETGTALSRKTSAIVIISAPAAEIETWDADAEEAPAWHFVIQDPETDEWAKVSESTWLGADDAERLLNFRKDFAGFDPIEADRARSQMYRCIQIDLDAYPPVACQILQQVMRVGMEFSGRGPHLVAELAMQRESGAGWYNDEAGAIEASQVVAQANVLIFDRPLGKLDKDFRPDLKPFFTPLAQAELLPTYSVEMFDEEIEHKKVTRFGFASSEGVVTAQSEEWATNLLTGYRPNVAIYRAPELAVVNDRGADVNDREDKEDRAKTLAEAIAADAALAPRSIVIKGFYPLELDGRISSIVLSQSAVTTTAICDAWNAPTDRLRGRGEGDHLQSTTGVAGRTDRESRSKSDWRSMRRGECRRGAQNATATPAARGTSGIQVSTVKITSEVEDQENKFLAKAYGGNLNVASTADLAESDLGDQGDDDEIEVWDEASAGRGKKLKVGDIVHVVHGGYNEAEERQIFKAINTSASASGAWIVILSSSEVTADQEWSYTVNVLDSTLSVVDEEATYSAANTWETIPLAGYENESVTGLYPIPDGARVWATWINPSSLKFSERNEPKCGEEE